MTKLSRSCSRLMLAAPVALLSARAEGENPGIDDPLGDSDPLSAATCTVSAVVLAGITWAVIWWALL